MSLEFLKIIIIRYLTLIFTDIVVKNSVLLAIATSIYCTCSKISSNVTKIKLRYFPMFENE